MNHWLFLNIVSHYEDAPAGDALLELTPELVAQIHVGARALRAPIFQTKTLAGAVMIRKSAQDEDAVRTLTSASALGSHGFLVKGGAGLNMDGPLEKAWLTLSRDQLVVNTTRGEGLPITLEDAGLLPSDLGARPVLLDDGEGGLTFHLNVSQALAQAESLSQKTLVWDKQPPVYRAKNAGFVIEDRSADPVWTAGWSFPSGYTERRIHARSQDEANAFLLGMRAEQFRRKYA